MNRKILCGIFLVLIGSSISFSQNCKLRLLEWNVENLFDCKNDSLKEDYDFLPGSIKHWNSYKYSRKLLNISKTIAIISKKTPIELIALTEIENDNTLDALVNHSPLMNMGYCFLSTHSLDKRGIDVALLYQPFRFKPLLHYSIRPHFSKNKKSRDILFVKGTTYQKDTLYLFICHFPSRAGGYKNSEQFRKEAAFTLRFHIDSLYKKNKSANIIITGDFNDEANNSSLKKVLKSIPLKNNIILPDSQQLYTLSYHQKTSKGIYGTYKYRGQWCQLDQIIVNGVLLKKKNSISTSYDACEIIDEDFLLEKDKTNGGNKPYRTYCGPRYIGGFSDHLPLYIEFN